jgi:hypothetical protein
MKYYKKDNSNTVYYLVTETEIYRTDRILQQIDEWIDAFKVGKIVLAPGGTQIELDEFEAHLEAACFEMKSMIRHDLEF